MGQVCSGGKDEANKGSAIHSIDESVLVSDDDHSGLNYLKKQQLQPDVQQHPSSASSLQPQQQQQLEQHHGVGSGGTSASNLITIEEKERLRLVREEHNRLNMIVSIAGRGMVSVRSTRGSTGYYDQGFAAALAQHLEQTTSFPNRLPVLLPPPPRDEYDVSIASGDDTKHNNNNMNKARMGVMVGGGSGIDVGSTMMDNNHNHSSVSSTSILVDGHKTSITSSTLNGYDDTNKTTTILSPLYVRLSQPAWKGLALASGGGVAGCGGEDPNRFMDNVAESLLDTVVPAKQQLFASVQPMVENLL
jgi:hypothetical protein